MGLEGVGPPSTHLLQALCQHPPPLRHAPALQLNLALAAATPRAQAAGAAAAAAALPAEEERGTGAGVQGAERRVSWPVCPCRCYSGGQLSERGFPVSGLPPLPLRLWPAARGQWGTDTSRHDMQCLLRQFHAYNSPSNKQIHIHIHIRRSNETHLALTTSVSALSPNPRFFPVPGSVTRTRREALYSREASSTCASGAECQKEPSLFVWG